MYLDLLPAPDQPCTPDFASLLRFTARHSYNPEKLYLVRKNRAVLYLTPVFRTISYSRGKQLIYRRKSEKFIANTGYGSEGNYSYMESNGIEAYVKYSYFHKEQKRSFNFIRKTCTIMLKRITSSARWDKKWKKSEANGAGYTSSVTCHHARRCDDVLYAGAAIKASIREGLR